MKKQSLSIDALKKLIEERTKKALETELANVEATIKTLIADSVGQMVATKLGVEWDKYDRKLRISSYSDGACFWEKYNGQFDKVANETFDKLVAAEIKPFTAAQTRELRKSFKEEYDYNFKEQIKESVSALAFERAKADAAEIINKVAALQP